MVQGDVVELGVVQDGRRPEVVGGVDQGQHLTLFKDASTPCIFIIYLRHLQAYPTSNGGRQNGSSVGISTHCMHVFCTFGARLVCSSRCLVTKISASELSRKLIKGALLVGYYTVAL